MLTVSGKVLSVRIFPASERGPAMTMVNVEGLTLNLGGGKNPEFGQVITASVYAVPYRDKVQLLVDDWVVSSGTPGAK